MEAPGKRTPLAIGDAVSPSRMLTAVAVCAALALTVACESRHGFWVRNETQNSVLLRLDETGDWTYVYRIDPHSDGLALSRFGSWDGDNVEILDPQCQTLASFEVGRGGASILIDADGPRLADRDEVIPEGNPSRRYERVDRCGASTPEDP